MPPLPPPMITVWPPLPLSGIGCCGSIGIIAICGAAAQQVVVRVTTRLIWRTLGRAATMRLALCFLTTCLIVGAGRLCLTYCTVAAGASATWTAPPPSTAPPAANAASLTSAIRTDIAALSSTLLARIDGNHMSPAQSHNANRPEEG